MTIPDSPLKGRSMDDIIAHECATDPEFARVWPGIQRQTANEFARWARKRERGPWRHHSRPHRRQHRRR